MRIKLIKDGSIAEVEDNRGERLIEHGIAVPAGAAPKTVKAKPAPKAEAPDEEAETPKPAAKKAGKKR